MKPKYKRAWAWFLLSTFADVGITIYGLSYGFSELNPLINSLGLIAGMVIGTVIALIGGYVIVRFLTRFARPLAFTFNEYLFMLAGAHISAVSIWIMMLASA